jgi:integrase
MAKKIFASGRLVKSGKRWIIDYTIQAADSENEVRRRKDFNLNDIENEAIRAAVGEWLAQNIQYLANALLPEDEAVLIAKATDEITIRQALAAAVAEKKKSPRKNSHKGYVTISNQFLEWAENRGIDRKGISTFTRKDAKAFADYVFTQKEYRHSTLNNKIKTMRGLWFTMKKELELVEGENPWSNIKAFRKQEKLRRVFTDKERRIVAAEVQKDYWLYRALLLQFYCYIRPVEITRLRFRDFDLAKGLVTVQEGDAKKWRKVVKTIPREVLHHFIDGKFETYPVNYYVFGRREVGNNQYIIAPWTTKCDDDRMYRKHKKILDRLVKEGKLENVDGLTWYSWKDTGISMHTRITSPVATKDQAGHTDLTTTSIYYTAPEINEEYKALGHDLHL